MNISYKWLKDYIDIDLRPEDLERILTQTGLEVGSIEEVESITRWFARPGDRARADLRKTSEFGSFEQNNCRCWHW